MLIWCGMHYLVLQCLWPLKSANESSCFAKRQETFKKGKREAMWHISGTCIEGKSIIKWRISVIVSGEGANVGHVALRAWMEESRRKETLSSWTGIAPTGISKRCCVSSTGSWERSLGTSYGNPWSEKTSWAILSICWAAAVKCVCLQSICCTQHHMPRAFRHISEPYS